jgi:hypothetical protein
MRIGAARSVQRVFKPDRIEASLQASALLPALRYAAVQLLRANGIETQQNKQNAVQCLTERQCESGIFLQHT